MAEPGFLRLDVDRWTEAGTETDGLSEHSWMRDPETDLLWLFKPNVVHDDREQGEDWAEKIASEVGQLLGLPVARIELARRAHRQGCLSLDLVPRGWEQQPGAVLIGRLIKDYESRTKDRQGHSLANIRQVLRDFAAPPGSALPPEFEAFDVFAGYLVLDALIANRDRHDNNWAVLRPPGGGRDHLCGSYDHASGLGFGLTDAERSRWLAHDGVARWARRGTAYKFEREPGGRLPSLVGLAQQAFAMVAPTVRDFWMQAVADLAPRSLENTVHRVPDLSGPTLTFTTQLLMTNRQRLLSEDERP
jgi:hypothetical protein